MWFPPAEGLQGGQSGGGRRSDAAPFGAPGWFPTSRPPWDRVVPAGPGASACFGPGGPEEAPEEDVPSETIEVIGKKPKPKKPKDRPEEPVEWFPPAVELPVPGPSLPEPGSPGGPPLSGGPAPGDRPVDCVDVVDVVQQFTMADLKDEAVCDEAVRWLRADMTVACWARGGDVKKFSGDCVAMPTSTAPGQNTVYLGSVRGELVCCEPAR